MSANPRTGSGSCSKYYATVAADADLVTDCPLWDARKGAPLPRQIVIMGSGDLSYKEEYDSTTTITVPVTAPYTLNLGAVRTLVSATTTATKLLVIW